MNAEIIAVGSELLTPQRTDTNSLYLTSQLNGLGVEVVGKSIVGDHAARLEAAVRLAAARSEILLLTGGLGPTEDDLTREAVAAAFGLKLLFRGDIAAAIERRFARMGRRMAEVNRRQAHVIEGAEVLSNDVGTAPGQWLRHGNGVVALLPGPPAELHPMFERECLPRLRDWLPRQVIETRVLRVTGMPESDLDQLISPHYKRFENPVTTILAAPGDLQIHFRARCETVEEASALLQQASGPIEELLGDRVYSRDGQPLEAVVGELLRRRKATLSVAESCTGGLLAERITSVPGSSDYFLGGFLTYTDRMKQSVLGVAEELIKEHSAVSGPVAEAMAEAARRLTGADFSLSVTGYAGPGGGSAESPAGAVWIGLGEASGCEARRFNFLGDRDRVRRLAVQAALEMLRRKLL